MGIVKDYIKKYDILKNYGFEYGLHSGPNGECGWTRAFSHNDDFNVLWVTVNNRNVFLYDEYSCGGVLHQESLQIPEEYQTELEILDYVDDVVTRYINRS